MLTTLPRVVVIAAIANLAVIASVIASDLHGVHAENALFENIQAVCLISAALLYALSSFGNKSTDRIELMGLALLCFSFSLREIDIELFGLPPLIEQFFVGKGRTATLLVLWGGYLALLLRQPIGFVDLIKRQFDSGLVAYLLIAACLLVCGAVFDRGILMLNHPRLYEELLEVNAYLLLFIPAAKAIMAVARKPQDQSVDSPDSVSLPAVK
jgi:hypothetical protein